MPGRARLMLDDTSGYLAAPLPGQLSRTLPSGPFPSLAPASSSFWKLPGRQLKPPSGTIGKWPVLGQILAGSLLGPDFGNLPASGPQLKPPSGMIGKRARFGPNPGREPFGAKFWPFGGFRAAIKTAFWDYWEMACFGPNPGREPFGARFWHFADFWKPLESFWEASKTPGNGRAPGSSARRPENTKAQAFFKASFSQSDASSRTPFVVTWELYFAFLKLETAFLAAQDPYRACSELVSAMKDSQGDPPGRESIFPQVTGFYLCIAISNVTY